MSRILRDEEITALLTEGKPLPARWSKRLEPRSKPGDAHKRRALKVHGNNGSLFRIDVRQNGGALFDFSIILTFVDGDGAEYRLVRFNGKHPSDHTNKWERRRNRPNARFRNAFHIHQATERYQTEPGCTIDGYAEVTNRYHSFESALQAFVGSNGFFVESLAAPESQPLLPFSDEDNP